MLKHKFIRNLNKQAKLIPGSLFKNHFSYLKLKFGNYHNLWKGKKTIGLSSNDEDEEMQISFIVKKNNKEGKN